MKLKKNSLLRRIGMAMRESGHSFVLKGLEHIRDGIEMICQELDADTVTAGGYALHPDDLTL